MFRNIRKAFRKKFGSDRHYYQIMDDIFGICPNNIELYKLALIHRSASFITPDGTAVNNERLEYLGDAVLELVISEYLFIAFPNEKEGFLTQTRSKIVSRNSLNELSVKIGLSEHIISNSGIGFIQKHLHGDALEAIIGAIYLDKGYEFTNRLVIDKILTKHINLGETTHSETDHKSRLIEWCQKSKHSIRFETSFSDESTSRNPAFRSVAVIDEMELGYGFGSSKKEAEQNASAMVAQALSDRYGDRFLEWADELADSIQVPGSGEPGEDEGRKEDREI